MIYYIKATKTKTKTKTRTRKHTCRKTKQPHLRGWGKTHDFMTWLLLLVLAKRYLCYAGFSWLDSYVSGVDMVTKNSHVALEFPSICFSVWLSNTAFETQWPQKKSEIWKRDPYWDLVTRVLHESFGKTVMVRTEHVGARHEKERKPQLFNSFLWYQLFLLSVWFHSHFSIIFKKLLVTKFSGDSFAWIGSNCTCAAHATDTLGVAHWRSQGLH